PPGTPPEPVLSTPPNLGKEKRVPVIAIIGSGHIGGTLSRKWAGTGHEVTFAARQPQKPGLQTLAQEVGARVAPTAEAVRAAEVVVFAIPGGAMAAIVPELGPLLNAKIVVDAANNVGGAAMNSAADVAAAAPGAHY